MKKLFLLLLLPFILLSCEPKKIEKIDTPAQRTGINDSLAKIGYIADTVKIISLEEFEGTFLYKKNCSYCHGQTGHGDGVVARFHPETCPAYDLSKEEKSDEVIYYIILKGKNGMPAEEDKLTEKDIWVLVIHIKKFKD